MEKNNKGKRCVLKKNRTDKTLARLVMENESTRITNNKNKSGDMTAYPTDTKKRIRKHNGKPYAY